MEKYELYKLTDMKGNDWNVMKIYEPVTENEIDSICMKYGIDEVKYCF